MTKKECFNCKQIKEGNDFLVPVPDTDEETRISRFFCWDCSQNIVQQELDNCANWERNKKKIFWEALEKFKNKKGGDWPWRLKQLNKRGQWKWDRIVATCPQCKIYLYWDVSVYEDSIHHVCS